MKLHVDKSVVFQDNNILNLARSNWPKENNVYHVLDSNLFIKVETKPMYITGVEPSVTQTNPNSWGVLYSVRDSDGNNLKEFLIRISVFLELPLEYIGNTKDVENTEE